MNLSDNQVCIRYTTNPAYGCIIRKDSADLRIMFRLQTPLVEGTSTNIVKRKVESHGEEMAGESQVPPWLPWLPVKGTWRKEFPEKIGH